MLRILPVLVVLALRRLLGWAPAWRRPVAPDPVAVGENLGAMTAAGGDVWVNDFGREELLRVSGRDGRVPHPAEAGRRVGAGRGRRERVGAALGRALLPHPERAPLPDRRRTGRITRRIPLDPEQIYFGVLAGAGAVWVWGPRHVVRIDPASGSILADFDIMKESGDLTGAVLEGDGLAVSTVDGHLLHIRSYSVEHGSRAARWSAPSCSPSTGAGRSPPWPARSWPSTCGRAGCCGGGRWASGSRRCSRARASCSPTAPRSATPATGLAIDTATGRVLAAAVVPSFGTTSMISAGGALWFATSAGELIAVPPFVVDLFVDRAHH